MNTEKRTPYIVCPECGSHLDPGEPCDCRKDKSLLEAGRNIDQSLIQSPIYREAIYKNFTRGAYR